MDTNRNIISPINCCSNTIHKKSDGFSNQITLKLNAYLRERSLSDPQWSKAISSQYFLIETANILNLTTINSYQELEEEFFNTSCIFRKGVVQPSPQKILVVPDENEKLIEDISKWLEVASLGIDSIEVKENKGIVSVLNKDILCEVENKGYGIIKITQENSIYKANIVKDD